MILYHQSRDSFHCCFRIACILSDSKIHRMEFDKVRILDFYSVFPHFGVKFKFPKHLRHARKAFQQAPEQYERISSPTRVFSSMSDIQLQSVRSMIGIGLISSEPFTSGGIVTATDKATNIFKKLSEENSEKKTPWFQAIVQDLTMVELLGEDGLKARSGLMEHHYDIS